jgi:hypothetical protein
MTLVVIAFVLIVLLSIGLITGPRTPARIFSKGWVFCVRMPARYSQGWR